jgi:hypothetical protein
MKRGQLIIILIKKVNKLIVIFVKNFANKILLVSVCHQKSLFYDF